MLLTKDNSFYCLKPNGVYTRVRWKYFLLQCPKVIFMDVAGTPSCNTNSGAYVAAITVCNQQLWTGHPGEWDV